MKRLKPPVSKIVTQQCQAVPDSKASSNGYWHERREANLKAKGFKRGQCYNHAQYEIEGTHLCVVHARKVALQLIESGEYVAKGEV